MKDTILEKTSGIFLKFGFKSVTMDDIAGELGMSKKTLYKYFKNKEDLIDQVTMHSHTDCHQKVHTICSCGYNAIKENFEIKKTFKDMLQNLDESPVYQLKKYYPETYRKIMTKELTMFQEIVSTNIKNGIEEGLYRKNINISVTSRFYFALVFSVKNEKLFSQKMNTHYKLEMEAMEYHIRAIATKKGIKVLEEELSKFNLQ